MSKGYQANKERQDEINNLGKAISKRAGFKCEWCECKDDLRVWDYQPEVPPEAENLALLCENCREWAVGKKAAPHELHSIRNALWSNIPAVAEGAARVLAQCKEAWAKEAIEESFIGDSIKAEILK
jgi:protein PhnA